MAETVVKRTGYTNETAKAFLVDAGAVYKNLKYDQASKKWKGELLGATEDGNKVKIEVKTRDIKIDGTFSMYKGQKQIESTNAELEVKVKELTHSNIALAILGKARAAEATEAPDNYQVIEGTSKLTNDQYLDNIGLVGTVTGSNEPVVIVLDNALCVSGLEVDFKDNSEAVATLKFQAHADENQVADRKLPCRIYYPKLN